MPACVGRIGSLTLKTHDAAHSCCLQVVHYIRSVRPVRNHRHSTLLRSVNVRLHVTRRRPVKLSWMLRAQNYSHCNPQTEELFHKHVASGSVKYGSTHRTIGLRSNAEFQPCEPPMWPRFFVSDRCIYAHTV